MKAFPLFTSGPVLQRTAGVLLAAGLCLCATKGHAEAAVHRPASEADLPSATSVVSIAVDALADRHAISPLVYGVCFGTSNQLRAINAPLNRHGGNATSRYNWLTNAANHAADWYFESLEEPGAVPGGAVDDFIRGTREGGAEAMVTIPINGWVAKLGPNRDRLCSFSIAKYGAQTGSDAQWFPDAGNGIAVSTGKPITNNNPNDANMPADSAFQAGWLRHLTNRWGTAAGGGVRYYLMDNEWGIWHETHRDVWPIGVTMEQERDRFCDYAAMVKDVDPAALVAGPEEWGWSGYLYSGYDAQWGAAHGWMGALPDRAAHGGRDMAPWWLNQVRLRSQQASRRLLDLFSLHFYPQGGEFSSDVSPAMQLRRNRSTRALWDTNYVDETWINDAVRLIPRMRQWVATNYPGTPIGITEYNWGADGHINGATAQADVLGILGREGVDVAARWTCPALDTPVCRAFQMYRNYDGKCGTFGDTSVRATAPAPDSVSAFAAVRSSDGALTVMIVSKQPGTHVAMTLSLANVTHAGVARVWQLTSTNAIARLADAAVVTNRVIWVLPAQSVTLFVVPAPPRLDRTAVPSADSFAFRLAGESGQTYVTQASFDFEAWDAIDTNILLGDSATITVPATNDRRFFRAAWRP